MKQPKKPLQPATIITPNPDKIQQPQQKPVQHPHHPSKKEQQR